MVEYHLDEEAMWGENNTFVESQVFPYAWNIRAYEGEGPGTHHVYDKMLRI